MRATAQGGSDKSGQLYGAAPADAIYRVSRTAVENAYRFRGSIEP